MEEGSGLSRAVLSSASCTERSSAPMPDGAVMRLEAIDPSRFIRSLTSTTRPIPAVRLVGWFQLLYMVCWMF